MAGAGKQVIFGLFGKRFQSTGASVNGAVRARRRGIRASPRSISRAGFPTAFEGRFESLDAACDAGAAPPARAAGAGRWSGAGIRRCLLRLISNSASAMSGISDVAVPKRMKKIGQMFYGRLQAYEAALAAPAPGSGRSPLNAAPATPEAARRCVGTGRLYAAMRDEALAALRSDAISRPAGNSSRPFPREATPCRADIRRRLPLSHPLRVETIRQRGSECHGPRRGEPVRRRRVPCPRPRLLEALRGALSRSRAMASA